MKLGRGDKAKRDSVKALIDIENLTPDKFFNCVKILAEELGMEEEKRMIDEGMPIVRRLVEESRASEMPEKEPQADEKEKASKSE